MVTVKFKAVTARYWRLISAEHSPHVQGVECFVKCFEFSPGEILKVTKTADEPRFEFSKFRGDHPPRKPLDELCIRSSYLASPLQIKLHGPWYSKQELHKTSATRR